MSFEAISWGLSSSACLSVAQLDAFLVIHALKRAERHSTRTSAVPVNNFSA
tara:strand:- start:251 stop:403 length:153 start_codon:yes stop_codon:yes gene_type:complete